MTEKRFTFDIDQENGYDEEPYFCDGTDSFYVNNTEEMGLFLKEVNGLHQKKEILEEQLESATNEIKKLMAEINMLTDTCHDCCKEIREENNELKGFFKELKKSGYWNEKFLIEQDWSDLKSWINIVMDRLE